MIKSPVINPKVCKGWVSRTSVLGTNSYNLDNLYSPDTSYDKSCVFDLASPKFEPNKLYAFDKSRYGNHGTITGAVWNTLPSGTKTLDFNGDDLINIDSILNQLATTTAGTWEGWFKLTDATPAAISVLLSFNDTDAIEFINIRADTNGKIRALCYDAGVAQWSLVTNSVVLVDNTWVHLALTQDGTAPVLYVNGVAVAQTFTLSTNKTRWFSVCTGIDNGRIGCSNYNSTGNAEFLTGSVGIEVRLHTRCLSAAELLDHVQTERHLFPF